MAPAAHKDAKDVFGAKLQAVEASMATTTRTCVDKEVENLEQADVVQLHALQKRLHTFDRWLLFYASQ